MKPCLIRQPAGIGDIFFTQKIAKLLISKNRCDKIIWPVASQYNYLNDYIGTDHITYICESENFAHKDIYLSSINTLYEREDLLYIPLQHADQTTTLPECRAHGHIKYKFCNNLSHADWKDYFQFNRNLDRELQLVDKLGIDINEPYNLVNRNYGSPPGNLIREDIVPDNDHNCVYMEFYNDIHLFDWLTIAENAKQIHTMETSLCYLLEKIDLTNVHVYSKYTVDSGIDDFNYIKSNYSDEWTYVR